MILMALDVSTTTIGIAIIEYDDGYQPSVMYSDWIRPNATGKKWHELTPVEQLEIIRDTSLEIHKLAKMFLIDEFVIEDYVRFMGGGSTANTIIPLAILNSSLRMTIWRDFGIEPQPLSVMKIRHALKLAKDLPTKEEIPKLLDKILKRKAHDWEYKTNKRTKKKELTQEMYDVADAIAAGLAYVKIKSSPKKKRTPKKRSSRKRK
jgi:hypothetical protein